MSASKTAFARSTDDAAVRLADAHCEPSDAELQVVLQSAHQRASELTLRSEHAFKQRSSKEVEEAKQRLQVLRQRRS